MGRRKNTPQVTNTTQNSAPWSGQSPFLSTGFERARNQLEGAIPFYPGPTIAPWDPAELEAMSRGEQRARSGSASTNAARDYAMGILSGDPAAMRSTLGPRVGELLPQLQSQFNRAGMGNSSLGRMAEQELIMRLTTLLPMLARRVIVKNP